MKFLTYIRTLTVASVLLIAPALYSAAGENPEPTMQNPYIKYTPEEYTRGNNPYTETPMSAQPSSYAASYGSAIRAQPSSQNPSDSDSQSDTEPTE